MTIYVEDTDFLLRSYRKDDAAALVENLNNFDVTGWLVAVPYPYTMEDASFWLGLDEDEWPKRAAIEADGVLIGGIAMDPGLGYWIAPTHWGRGIATRAAKHILDAHFAMNDTEYTTSGAIVGNEASLHIQAKLGFVEVDRYDKYCRSHGKDMPHIDTRLSRLTWEGRQVC